MPQHRRSSAIALAAALVLVAGCRDASGPGAATGPLTVTIEGSELRLRNRGARRVFAFVEERERLRLILWGACADDRPACPRLEPGAVDTVRFTPENRLAPGREAVVTWWYARQTAAGPVPDSLRTFIVRL